MWKSISVGLTGLVFLGGCAVGVKHDYNQTALDLGATTSATVAVGTLDHRPYVTAGTTAPNFVGMSRGGFGNPFDVTTKSGKPLASDISGSIVGSMKGKGVDAQVVELKPALSSDAAKTALLAAGTQRSVMITLQAWESDTMINIGFTYDLILQILDKEGKLLASKAQLGNENLGSTGFTPGGGDAVLARFRRMMEGIFQDPDVAKALQP
jgi:hypothetical protein